MEAKPTATVKVVQKPKGIPHGGSRRQVVIIVLIAAVAVLIAGRIALPFAVKHLVNTRIERIPGYS